MDKEIISHLRNTIALMGGKEDILNILSEWECDKKDKKDILQELMNWNMKKVDEIKDRLSRSSGQAVNITHLN